MFADFNAELHALGLERGLAMEHARRVEYAPVPSASACTACGRGLADLRTEHDGLATIDTPVLTDMFVVLVVGGLPYCTHDEAFAAAAAAG